MERTPWAAAALAPWRRWRGPMISACALFLLAGCSSLGRIGSFDSTGFRHEKYAYSVRSGPDGRILPPDWRLDNFQMLNGRPDRPKVGDGYVTQIGLDVDDDGRTDKRPKMYLYDLRYEHSRTAGAIWLRTFPISNDRAHTELRVLMRQYVDAVSGAGFVQANLGSGLSGGIERRFATRILDSQKLRAHGLPAFGATMEVANVDQLRLSPNSRWERARIVLIRTPFEYRVGSGLDEATYPVLMLVGYTNLPEDFDAGLPAFLRFLNEITFADAPPGVPPGVQVVGTPPPPPGPPPQGGPPQGGPPQGGPPPQGPPPSGTTGASDGAWGPPPEGGWQDAAPPGGDQGQSETEGDTPAGGTGPAATAPSPAP